jgi:hypothetical protein
VRGVLRGQERRQVVKDIEQRGVVRVNLLQQRGRVSGARGEAVDVVDAADRPQDVCLQA